MRAAEMQVYAHPFIVSALPPWSCLLDTHRGPRFCCCRQNTAVGNKTKAGKHSTAASTPAHECHMHRALIATTTRTSRVML